tara:strand:- start:728 stop:856 length:129 start_codon:yes stop_codon:yes gene_type:complete
MDKINLSEEELQDIKELTANGNVIANIIDKINEIIDWINKQE